MKDLRTRIKSLENTRQLTKAMEMIAASRLRGAQARALTNRPYFRSLYETVRELAANADRNSPFVRPPAADRACYVVIAGDRGLAGGYNGNVLKLAMAELRGKEAVVLPMGKKAVEFFRRQNVERITELYDNAEAVTMAECTVLAQELCRDYLAGRFARICVCYTEFVSILTQTPVLMPLLPLPAAASGSRSAMICEPENVLHTLIPAWLGGVIYGALGEALAGEQAARRSAMDAAARNAGEMIDELRLRYNRARQSAITQEITEIVAGAEY